MKIEESRDPVEDHRNVKREVREWEIYLNDNIGYFAFTFAIASIGTSQPQFWAFISLIFTIIVHLSKKDEQMQTLRDIEKKKNKTDYEIFLTKQIRSTISIKRSLPFTMGFFTLLIIIFAPSLLPSREAINFIYGEKPYFDTRNLEFVKPNTKP